jgi:hypothetical protein
MGSEFRSLCRIKPVRPRIKYLPEPDIWSFDPDKVDIAQAIRFRDVQSFSHGTSPFCDRIVKRHLGVNLARRRGQASLPAQISDWSENHTLAKVRFPTPDALSRPFRRGTRPLSFRALSLVMGRTGLGPTEIKYRMCSRGAPLTSLLSLRVGARTLSERSETSQASGKRHIGLITNL